MNILIENFYLIWILFFEMVSVEVVRFCLLVDIVI